MGDTPSGVVARRTLSREVSPPSGERPTLLLAPLYRRFCGQQYIRAGQAPRSRKVGSWAGEGGGGERRFGLQGLLPGQVLQRVAEQIIEDDKVEDRAARKCTKWKVDVAGLGSERDCWCLSFTVLLWCVHLVLFGTSVGFQTCLGVCRPSCFNALTQAEHACREVLSRWFGNHFSVDFFQAMDVPVLVTRCLCLKSHTKRQGSTALRGAEPQASRVVVVDVWRGSGGAVLRSEHVARAASLGNLELFLRAPVLADTCPRACDSLRSLLREFLHESSGRLAVRP